MRHAADRHDQPVERRALRARRRRPCNRRRRRPCRTRTVAIFTPSLDRETLLRERLLRFLRDRFVGGAEECRQRLEDRDLRAQPPPDAAHLEADDARADDAEALRHVGYRERARVVEHAHVVERPRRAARAAWSRWR